MRIGITPYCREGDIRQPYIPAGYSLGLWGRQAEMVVFDYTKSDEELMDMLEGVDGFLFSGGPDVNPARYGRAREPKCEEPNLRRDEVEFMLFPRVLEKDMPVLAICRGIQMVNVALGGTLVQHVDGHQMHSGVYGHDLIVAPDSRLMELAGGNGRILTNTYHHQHVDDLAESLTPVAWTDSGIIEAAVRPASRFFAAYQWHPEVTLRYDALSNRIFDDFIQACGKT